MKRHKNVSIFLKGNEDNRIYTSTTVSGQCVLATDAQGTPRDKSPGSGTNSD